MSFWLPRRCSENLSGAKNMTHNLAGDTVPVSDHAVALIKTMQCIALCILWHLRTLAYIYNVRAWKMIKLHTPSFEQKCHVPAGFHDTGTKFYKWWSLYKGFSRRTPIERPQFSYCRGTIYNRVDQCLQTPSLNILSNIPTFTFSFCVPGPLVADRIRFLPFNLGCVLGIVLTDSSSPDQIRQK